MTHRGDQDGPYSSCPLALPSPSPSPKKLNSTTKTTKTTKISIFCSFPALSALPDLVEEPTSVPVLTKPTALGWD
jgi:phosphoribosylcarboxyaminoimidazole (NCAIR) mutase